MTGRNFIFITHLQCEMNEHYYRNAVQVGIITRSHHAFLQVSAKLLSLSNESIQVKY